jgi:hypothetical protein
MTESPFPVLLRESPYEVRIGHARDAGHELLAEYLVGESASTL